MKISLSSSFNQPTINDNYPSSLSQFSILVLQSTWLRIIANWLTLLEKSNITCTFEGFWQLSYFLGNWYIWKWWVIVDEFAHCSFGIYWPQTMTTAVYNININMRIWRSINYINVQAYVCVIILYCKGFYIYLHKKSCWISLLEPPPPHIYKSTHHKFLYIFYKPNQNFC